MRLTRLRIARLPGIDRPFEVADLDAGLNLVVGPNASGKSSLCRALRALLYREEQAGAFVDLEGEFEDEAGALRVRRLGRDIEWSRRGQPVAPPPLPEHRFISCYTVVVDDLLRAGATERDIAAQIARELSGGYDLAALRGAPLLHLKSTHGRDEARALRAAGDALAQRQRRHVEIRREELRLDALREEKAAAEDAAREAELHGRALELLEARGGRRELERRLAEEFPPAMDRLHGGEMQRLEELREQRRALEVQHRDAQRALEEAQRRLAQSGLAGADLDESAITGWRRRLERLRGLEAELRRLRDAQRGAAQRHAAALQELGGGAPPEALRLDPATLSRVEQELEAKRRLDAGLRALDAERERLPAADEAGPDAGRLRGARDALLEWLAAAPAGSARGWARIAGTLLLVLAAFGAIVLAFTASAAAALIALAVILGGWLLWPRGDDGPRRRREAQQRYVDTGLEAPAAWSVGEVRRRLDGVLRELAAAEEEALRRRRREELGRERAHREEERARVLEALAALARETGFDPACLDAGLQRWLRLVLARDEARAENERLQGDLEARGAEARALAAEAGAFLERFAAAPAEGGAAADDLQDALERLGERLRGRDASLRDARQAEREQARLQHALERNARDIDALFSGAGLESPDEAALRARLERLEAWRALRRQHTELVGVERERARALEGRDALLARVEADEGEALRRALERHRTRAERRDGIAKQINDIEKDVRDAQQGRSLEEARAARQSAADALGERLEEALVAAAGRFLIDEVEAEHRVESEPEVLRRAAEWFRHFTRNEFALEFAGAAEGRFAALDTAAGEHRRLDELSSGTRMQLLLAVRLAFALEAERGRSALPIFLDEALTTADPQRFRAVAESVRALARQARRQVFYLSAQPADAAPWRDGGAAAPRVIDMARVRGREGAITDAAAISLPPARAIPAPLGQSPEQYAVTLGVPPVDPWRPAAALHLFHLLRDDLGLLHRLLCAGVAHAGALRVLLGSAAAGTLLEPERQQALAARLAVAEAWVEAWREGRGRPVDREALVRCPAVTDRFIDDLTLIAERVGGDARALLAAIRARELKNFRGYQRERLEAWLRENEYLDPREPLAEHDVELRVLGEVRGLVEARRIDAAAVRELLRFLRAGRAAETA